VTFREFVAIIEGEGFRLVRQKGSHRAYEGFHSGRRWIVTVASHSLSDDISRGTLASMIRQSGLPKRLFR
jgi:predicted RNA binding protein YcfA (HicA-like mRNA interferase family)